MLHDEASAVASSLVAKLVANDSAVVRTACEDIARDAALFGRELRAAGGLAPLVQLLIQAGSWSHETACGACRALARLAHGSRALQDSICAAGAIEPLTQLLVPSKDAAGTVEGCSLTLLACDALTNIVAGNTTNQNRSCDDGAVQALVKLLRDANIDDVKLCALTALSSIVASNAASQVAVAAGVVSPLVAILKQAVEQVRFGALAPLLPSTLAAISLLTADQPAHQDALRAADGIGAVVWVLRVHRNSCAQGGAARLVAHQGLATLLHLFAGNSASQDAACVCGAVGLIVEMLRVPPRDDKVEAMLASACTTLTHLCAAHEGRADHFARCQQEFVSARGFAALVVLLSAACGQTLRLHALTAIGALVAGQRGCLTSLRKVGGLTVLIEQLQTEERAFSAVAIGTAHTPSSSVATGHGEGSVDRGELLSAALSAAAAATCNCGENSDIFWQEGVDRVP